MGGEKEGRREGRKEWRKEGKKKGKKGRKENNPRLCPNCRPFITVDNENESHKEHSWNFNS